MELPRHSLTCEPFTPQTPSGFKTLLERGRPLLQTPAGRATAQRVGTSQLPEVTATATPGASPDSAAP